MYPTGSRPSPADALVSAAMTCTLMASGTAAIVHLDVDPIVHSWRRRVGADAVAAVDDDLVEGEKVNIGCDRLIAGRRWDIHLDVWAER